MTGRVGDRLFGDGRRNGVAEMSDSAAFDDSSSLEVISVYLDMSKAFDKVSQVWHEEPLFKLLKMDSMPIIFQILYGTLYGTLLHLIGQY